MCRPNVLGALAAKAACLYVWPVLRGGARTVSRQRKKGRSIVSDIEKPSAHSEERKAASPAPQSGPQRTVAIGRTPAQRRWRAVGITFGTLVCLLSLAVGTVFGHFYWGMGKPLQDVIKQHGLEMS